MPGKWIFYSFENQSIEWKVMLIYLRNDVKNKCYYAWIMHKLFFYFYAHLIPFLPMTRDICNILSSCPINRQLIRELKKPEAYIFTFRLSFLALYISFMTGCFIVFSSIIRSRFITVNLSGIYCLLNKSNIFVLGKNNFELSSLMEPFCWRISGV